MNKNAKKVLLVFLMTIICIYGAVYAEDSVLPDTNTEFEAERSVDKKLPNDDELLDNPDAYIPGISDVFKTKPLKGAEVQAEPQAAVPGNATPYQQGHYNAYLRFPGMGIPGTANYESEHRGEMTVKFFELVGLDSGANDEKYLKIVKPVDEASSKLFIDSLNGYHHSEVILTVYRGKNSNQKMLRIKLMDVQITSYKMVGDAQNPGETVDEIHLNFARIEHELTTYNQDGSVADVIKRNYDVKQNKSY